MDGLKLLLNWQPINTLPGYPDDSLDVDSDEYYDQSYNFGLRAGMVLRRKDGKLEIIGHDTGGNRTRGCSCCSIEWIDQMDRYDAWAYLVECDN